MTQLPEQLSAHKPGFEYTSKLELPTLIQFLIALALMAAFLKPTETLAQTSGVYHISTCLYPHQFELTTSPAGRSYVQFDTMETWWKKAQLTVNHNGTALVTYGIGASAEPPITISFAADVAKTIPSSSNNLPIQDIEIMTTPNGTIMVNISQLPGVSECRDVGAVPDPTRTMTATPAETNTSTPTPTPSETPTPTVTTTIIPTRLTPEHTATVTVTPSPTNTVVIEMTATSTVTATATSESQNSPQQIYLPHVQR